MRLSVWPQSLFGRLIATSVLALVLAQAVSLVLVARERERFILQGSVREWSRRIAEVSLMLEGQEGAERAATAAKLTERQWHFGRHSSDVIMFRNGLMPAPDLEGRGPREGGALLAPGQPPAAGERLLAPPRGGALGPPPDESHRFSPRDAPPQVFLPFSMAGDFEGTFEQQLQANLGAGYHVKVTPTVDSSKRAIAIIGPLFFDGREIGNELYDANVTFPDGYTALFRVTWFARGAAVPRALFVNLLLLVTVLVAALFVAARSITRPLSELVRAADSVGRDLRQPKLEEKGARELRQAARAFNTMQDRLQRYLDSRSRVLAAMSHDLKTPLTRLRLQTEMLEDAEAQIRIGKQLDEMEGMVHGALALFRGLDDNEAYEPVDINVLLSTLRSEFAEMSAVVEIEGQAAKPLRGKPLALRRCLTNLIANAVKFGGRAFISVDDGIALRIYVRDEGPGIPEDQLERVFEPFYRVESSRNRDTGGTGLGLSIARDVVQSHGGSLRLRNLPVRGLEAIATLPRS